MCVRFRILKLVSMVSMVSMVGMVSMVSMVSTVGMVSMVTMHVRMRDGLLFGVNVPIFGTAVAVASTNTLEYT